MKRLNTISRRDLFKAATIGGGLTTLPTAFRFLLVASNSDEVVPGGEKRSQTSKGAAIDDSLTTPSSPPPVSSFINILNNSKRSLFCRVSLTLTSDYTKLVSVSSRGQLDVDLRQANTADL